MYFQKVLNLKDLQAFFTALSRRSETAVFMVYLYLMMSLFLLDLQSLKEPFHLLKRDLFYFFRRSGPLEFHIIQKFLGRQDKPILIIPEDFYRISFPVTEDEVNNPVPVSLLSGDRKPQIRFLGNHHSGSENLYHKSFRM